MTTADLVARHGLDAIGVERAAALLAVELLAAGTSTVLGDAQHRPHST